MPKAKRPITCCPYCGSTKGVYTRTTLINVPYCIGFDGGKQYNGEMYDNAEGQKGGAIAYCQDCGKIVCRMSTLEKQWDAAGVRY